MKEDSKQKINNRIKLLKKVNIFLETKQAILIKIALALSEIKLDANQVIFKKGEKSNAMYIIENGEVEVFEKNHIFTKLNNESFFGEYSLINDSVRTASVRTTKETYLLKLNRKDFLKILDENLHITLSILQSLVRRVEDKDKLEEQLVKQNKAILAQKKEIEKQKKEITDSIYYASAIQNAVFTSKTLVKQLLKEYFIFYLPKDIVSGDFYWVNEKDNKVIITAADCTGHGVPGAFMSMLGISFLNQIVNKNETLQANEILNKLRNLVKKSLRQTEKEDGTKDGIDMALCIIDFENLKLEFAGANNPLILIRNKEILEIKGDKMPIGIHIKEKSSFTNHFINLQKKDKIYLYSDGYIDQFGGKLGRKYLSKNFKKLLLENHEKDMKEQKEILKKTLKNWKNKNEQVDDILIIGVEII